VWLRIAFIGASVSAAGLIQLFDGEVQLLSALALAVGGGLLAVFSRRRARTALDIGDSATAELKVPATSPVSALAS
jgi:hypothetical protein